MSFNFKIIDYEFNYRLQLWWHTNMLGSNDVDRWSLTYSTATGPIQIQCSMYCWVPDLYELAHITASTTTTTYQLIQLPMNHNLPPRHAAFPRITSLLSLYQYLPRLPLPLLLVVYKFQRTYLDSRLPLETTNQPRTRQQRHFKLDGGEPEEHTHAPFHLGQERIWIL